MVTCRAIEEEYEERAPEDSHQTFNLPLPRGIDHEVPRWAAVYSMFQEVLHFLPPEDNISDQHENINVPESDESHLNMGAPERVAAQLSSNSTINAQGDTKHPASALESAPELPIHTLSPPCLGSDSAINEGFGLMGYSNSGEGLDLDDIDALLSF
ncbi:hypothetical protein BDV36DRAFT_292679 [Aspergillus pseudocaelatus]|uniref:Uncharacterized protein n=1 Tax=Aspergillus pseudocaelatus TaxID=1825620 RepID=A0ABQ6WV65_9EURO|nr:hypothetical protein BDV36DRAFT_292679 [Aspergillus pseudocaelatus]